MSVPQMGWLDRIVSVHWKDDGPVEGFLDAQFMFVLSGAPFWSYVTTAFYSSSLLSGTAAQSGPFGLGEVNTALNPKKTLSALIAWAADPANPVAQESWISASNSYSTWHDADGYTYFFAGGIYGPVKLR